VAKLGFMGVVLEKWTEENQKARVGERERERERTQDSNWP
jgi:hypothetical protein